MCRQLVIKLNNGTEMPIAGIAAPDRSTRCYPGTPEMLRRCAEMIPPMDGRK